MWMLTNLFRISSMKFWKFKFKFFQERYNKFSFSLASVIFAREGRDPPFETVRRKYKKGTFTELEISIIPRKWGKQEKENKRKESTKFLREMSRWWDIKSRGSPIPQSDHVAAHGFPRMLLVKSDDFGRNQYAAARARYYVIARGTILQLITW